MNKRYGLRVFGIIAVLAVALVSIIAGSCTQPPISVACDPGTPPPADQEGTDMTQIATRPIPPIDAAAPARVETATFSLG